MDLQRLKKESLSHFVSKPLREKYPSGARLARPFSNMTIFQPSNARQSILLIMESILHTLIAIVALQAAEINR